jgi:hypothetical protein
MSTPHPVTRPFTQLLIDFPLERSKDLVKAFGYTAYWAKQAFPSLPSTVSNFSFAMSDIKNLLSSFEIPSHVQKLWGTVSDLTAQVNKLGDKLGGWRGVAGRKLVKDKAPEIFKQFTALIGNIHDGIAYGAKYVEINKDTMSKISGINSVATLGGCGLGTLEQANKLWSGTAKHSTYTAMGLARDFSYTVVGAFGTYSYFTGATTASWKILACLTSGLVFTIGGHFYKQMYNPEDQEAVSRVRSTMVPGA